MNDVCVCGEPWLAHKGGVCQKTKCAEFMVDPKRSPAVSEDDLDFLAGVIDGNFYADNAHDQDRADGIIEKLRHQLFGAV